MLLNPTKLYAMLFRKKSIVGAILLALSTPSLSAFETKKITAIRIEGLSGLSEKEIIDKLGGRIDFITSRPPSRSRADDADFLVSRLLEKEGYSDVRISWKIPADRKSIILRVKTGPRLLINKVNIVGAEPSEAEVMQQYFLGKSLIGTAVETPYLPKNTEEAASSSITYLKSRGYWKAKGKLTEPQTDFTQGKIDLTVETVPGPLHHITSLTLDGSPPPELPNLGTTLQSYLTRPATAATLSEIRNGTTMEMREKGYQFAKSSLAATHKNGETNLTLSLVPGARYLLRGTEITGAEDIDYSRVQRLFNRLSDKPYDETEIKKIRNNLLASGAFDNVEQERDIDTEEAAIDVTLRLKKGRTKGVTGYLGTGSIEGFIIGGSYYNRNFLSKLYNLNIAGEFSNIGLLGEISITDPFLFGYDLRATPRAFALTRTFDEYFKFETGFGFTVTYKPNRRQTWEANALLSYATVSPEDLPSEALGATDYVLTTLGLNWLYDGRDSTVSPGKGFFARVRGELGGVAADTPNAFLRLEAQAAYHLPLNNDSRLGFNFRTGILSPTDEDELPIDLRYFIGGRNSVRSFPFRELGPNIDGTPRGGQSFWYANIEYIRRIAGPVYGVGFIDAGSLDESAAAWPSFDPKLAAGLGIRLDLPIGPIRFEYGVALNPAPEDPFGAFHFSIGAAF